MKFRKSDAIRVFASGGMGNQIFQFAFSAFLKQELNLKSEFLNLKVFKRIRHTNFDLIPFIDDKSFLSSPSSNFLKYFSYAVDPWHSLRMHVVWGQRFDFRFDHAISPDSHPHLNYPGYIVGYFQNYEFVSKVDSIVLQILSKIVKKPTSPMFEDLNYEAIHIRGGDFLRPSNRNTIGSLGRNYYNLLLPKKSSLPRIVITDDIDHAQTLLKKVNIDMYFDSSKLDFRESLFILGNARRIYIANSTYSWLGGFFGNEINDAEVVQPIPFFRSGRLNYGVKLLNPNFQKFPSNWA